MKSPHVDERKRCTSAKVGVQTRGPVSGPNQSDLLALDTAVAMARFAERYTDDQRLVMGRAMVDGGMTAREVVERAAAGTLELEGRRLEPFTISNASTVRDQAGHYRRRQAGELRSQLATAPPRDAIEDLRRRLINVADAELKALERQRTGERNPERSDR